MHRHQRTEALTVYRSLKHCRRGSNTQAQLAYEFNMSADVLTQTSHSLQSLPRVAEPAAPLKIKETSECALDVEHILSPKPEVKGWTDAD